MSYLSRTLSVYGGAGGRGTQISLSPSRPRAFNPSTDEKSTMQNLNNRLASYLEKVSSLEKANADLEQKIKDWYENHPDVTFDHTIFLDTIKDLRNMIQSASLDNAKLILSVDNSKMAAEDFKQKYENELLMRRVIETDIAKMRNLLDEFSLRRSDLEILIESLNEELIVLKIKHEEEMSLVRAEARALVNVFVDAAPSIDLNQTMSEIRQHYEDVTEKKRKKLESWHETKMATVQKEEVTQNLQSSRTEVKQLTNVFQMLKIDLQTQQSMRSVLDGELEETQAHYGEQLANLQTSVTSLEDHLSHLYANIANNKREYESLLDIKTRLELEIAKYRKLLDGDEREANKMVTKTITVVETIVDGEIVESSESMAVIEKDD